MWPQVDSEVTGSGPCQWQQESVGLFRAALAVILAMLVSHSLPAQDMPGSHYVDKRPIEIVAWRKPLTLQLEDGQQQNVLLRRTPPVITARTDSIATEYQEMRAAAEAGNANAAYALYKALRMCSAAPANQKELDSDIQRLRAERRLRIPRSPYVVAVPPDTDLGPIELSIRQVAARCQGVTLQRIGESKEWLDAALRGGVSWAYKDVAQNMPGESLFTKEGLHAWTAVWRTGSVAALSWIAKIHRNGLTDTATRSPDPVRAYAYQFIYVRLMRESAIASGGPVADLIASRLESDLSDWADSLTSADRQQAARIAHEVLAANESCCYLD